MSGTSQRPDRLFCLDLLRGLDMFYLVVVSMVFETVFPALGLDRCWLRFFCSHPWEGFTLYDLVMPLFIFMCGAAIPLSLDRRLVDGRPGPGYWRHVLSRVALLWFWGMMAQGDLTSLDLHQVGFYCNALQAIAVGYLVAACVIAVPSRKVRVAVPVLLTLAYGLLVHFLGDYTKDGNITQIVELKIVRALLPADNPHIQTITNYGSTWHLPSMMFAVITLAGAFATDILRRQDVVASPTGTSDEDVASPLGEWTRARRLALYGAGTLAVGWMLAFCGVKMVKHIFTVSFSLQAIGWSALLLAALYVLTDIWKFRRGMGLLILFGQFALVAYVCEVVFHFTLLHAADRLFSGLYRFFDPKWTETVQMVGSRLILIAVVVFWRQARCRCRK